MKTWQWLAIGAGLLVVAGLLTKDKIMEAIWDAISEKRIQGLHPAIRDRVRAYINFMQKEHGIKLRITEGTRTFQRQEDLYNQPWDGKDNDGDGSVDEADEKVTQAKPGSSFHNYGLAFDVVEMKDGKALWNNPNWKLIGQVGEKFGFEWGGDWNFVDLPHFQYPPNTKASELLAWKNAGEVDNEGWLKNVA